MSQWAEIRHQHLVEGVAKKQIARRLQLDIKTVRRAVEQPTPPVAGVVAAGAQPGPVAGADGGAHHGQELVVVQRVDLDVRTDPRAQELALADNRVAELDLDWDPAVLRQLEQAGVALEAFWTPEEFAPGPRVSPAPSSGSAHTRAHCRRSVVTRMMLKKTARYPGSSAAC